MSEHPRLELARSPLALVLGQVRFAPVMKMADHIPDIQEAMRNQGFVWFDKEQIQRLVWGPQISPEPMERWLLCSKEREELVVLTRDFVVYETSRYDRFEDFVKRFKVVLDVIKDVTDVSDASRVGLRYVNVIRSIDGKQPRELLVESIRGLTDQDLEARDVRHESVSEASTNYGRIRIRAIEERGEEFLPHDLRDTRVSFREKPGPDEVSRILDIDHFSTTDRDFKSPTLVKALWDLHSSIEKTFRAAVTKEAMEIWKKEANGQ